ncbi:MAG: serine/threonine protein kinase [Symploca sp. SIO2C1]|nr:serine/threonine protein kinase [Symploca sp. SIO2C1]
MLQVQQILHRRYQLQQQLGNNAGRQTWLAVDLGKSPQELVIVKLLAFHPQMQWNEFKLFEREAQILKELNHPRIPYYRDYFSLDKRSGVGLYWFGLVQQYIPGASLQQHLAEGKRFTETEVKNIAQEVLEILSYLHGMQPPVLHRDIKPSNLILGDDGQVYLVDFGAVQDSAAAEGVSFTVVGTTGYAPLEQFWGRAVPASDLYALGATLIHLLTGAAPADLPQQNLRIQFRDRISVNPRFIHWIEVLTAPELEQRFSNASEALVALKTNRYPKISLTQPPGSRVRLNKTPDWLSIKIPKKKRSLLDIIKLAGKLLLTIGSLPVLLFFSLVILLLIFLMFAALSHNRFGLVIFLINFIFILFMGVLWKDTSKELGKLQDEVSRTIRTLFGGYYLYFDRDNFIIERQLFGWGYLRHLSKIYDITELEQISFAEIAIKTRMVSYSFGQELTESERSWLVQEIQDWLDID